MAMRRRRLGPVVPDHLERVVQVLGRFRMHGNDIRPRCCKRRDLPLRLCDHQVRVEHAALRLAEGLDRIRSEGEVGNEHPIHHIEVNPMRSGLVNTGDFLAHRAKIGSQQRRCDDRSHGVRSRITSSCP